MTGFGAVAGAVCSTVVAVRKGAAVVVAEFYDDDVVFLDEGDERGEVVFCRVGSGTGSCDGFVDYGEGEGVGEEYAPPWFDG